MAVIIVCFISGMLFFGAKVMKKSANRIWIENFFITFAPVIPDLLSDDDRFGRLVWKVNKENI
jgi:hypothetical protein